jgi:hypothetical protein
MTEKITPDMAGTWLDGNQGWHNHHRVVDRAQAWGWKGLGEWEDGEEILTRYRANERTDDDIEVMIGQGGIVDEATEYLEGLAPAGYHFEWDMGELSLVACEDIEGHDPKPCGGES